jgi:hypothetical protein
MGEAMKITPGSGHDDGTGSSMRQVSYSVEMSLPV